MTVVTLDESYMCKRTKKKKERGCRKSANIAGASSGREGGGRARGRGREVRTVDGVEGVGRFLLNYHLGVHCRYRKFFNLNKRDDHVNHAKDMLNNTKKLDGAQKIPKNFTQTRQKRTNLVPKTGSNLRLGIRMSSSQWQAARQNQFLE
jgi:hypothetical protein